MPQPNNLKKPLLIVPPSASVSPSALKIATGLAAIVPPNAPSDLGEDWQTDTEVYFFWTLNGAAADSVEVWRDGALLTTLHQGIDSLTAFYDSGLADSTTYTYKVRAVNSAGASPFSPEVQFTTDQPHTPPAEPANFAVVALDPTMSRLTWEHTFSNCFGFVLYRCVDDGVYDWQTLASLGNELSYDDPDVEPNVTYLYGISAYNGWGETDSLNVQASVTMPDAPPNAPSNFSAFADSDTQISLSWVDNSSNETGFEIYRSTAVNGVYTLISTVGQNETDFIDSALTAGTTYYYKIRAINDEGASAYDTTSATTGAGQSVNLLSGLLGYWKIDEASGTRADSTANGNNLTSNNNVGSIAGKINNAGVFSASPDKSLSHADNTVLRFGGDFTVSIWVYWTAHQFEDSIILAKHGEFYLHRHDNDASKVKAELWSTTGVMLGSVVSNVALQFNQWYHVIAYRSGNTLGVVINNGTPVTAAVSAGTIQTSNQFRIGAHDGGYSWTGYLDECGKWNRKLNSAEIAALYNSGNGKPFSQF